MRHPAILGGILAPLGLILMATVATASGGSAAAGGVSPGQALKTLLAGNARYAAGRSTHPHQSPARRAALARSQHPIATVLACSDSRVPPTVIFDQGLGDLFVIRVAGNTADALGTESIDYAVKHLDTRLIVVLGHDKCGAVTAALAEYPKGDPGAMLQAIRPAVAIAIRRPGNMLSNSIDENVRLTVEQLRKAPEFAPLVRSGALKIVGGRYSLTTGKVKIFRF